MPGRRSADGVNTLGHWRQFDFRYSWLREALRALDAGIDRIVSSDEDGMHQAEHIEELVGLAFVALQAYIASTISDLRAAYPREGIERGTFLQQKSEPIAGLTCVAVTWHMGNYYKHHDEWQDWQPVGPRSETVRALERLGITETTELPCKEALRLLLGDRAELTMLLESVAAWRDAWFRELQEREENG